MGKFLLQVNNMWYNIAKGEKNMFSTEKIKQKALLVVVITKKNESKARKLDEITRLAESTGLEVIGFFVQNIKDFNKATVIGKGKVEEIKNYLQDNSADVVIVDYKLTGSQIGNLSNAFSTRVIDRVGLILDIFAIRAKTNEAKLQVKLAQNMYLLPKLRDVNETSNKYGGAGVGMSFPIVALVGYTNAGKSSLLNVLTKDNIYVEDKYFATLDTTSRKLYLNGQVVLLTDTVGFISELPHELVDSFASTLDEAKESDLILHIVDPTATSLDGKELYYEESMRVTNKVLDDIGATQNRLIVYNKCDLVENRKKLSDNEIYVSTKTKEGIEKLKNKIINLLWR